MAGDIVISLAIAAAIVLMLNQIGRILRAFSLQKTIRQALTKDSGLTAGLLDKIDEQPQAAVGDDRIGVVLLALGAATFFYGLIQGDADDIRNLAGIALFPTFVGAALLARLWYINRRGEVS